MQFEAMQNIIGHLEGGSWGTNPNDTTVTLPPGKSPSTTGSTAQLKFNPATGRYERAQSQRNSYEPKKPILEHSALRGVGVAEQPKAKEKENYPAKSGRPPSR
jgi:hypothetical protein